MYLKKIFLLIVIGLFVVSLSAQTNYTIKGKVPSTNKASIAVMSYPPNDKGGAYKADTTAIQDGKFEFNGTIGRPQLAELNLIIPHPEGSKNRRNQSNEDGNNMKNVALFYLDGNINITFDESGMASYTGGNKEEKAWREYEKMSIARSKALNGTPITIAFYEELITDFVKSHPDSYVSVDLMDLFTQGSIQPGLVEPMYNALSKRMKNSEKILGWVKKLEEAKLAVSGNQTAPSFSMNNTEGKPVSLESYRGSYLLLDFWASWCMPCRAENPNVLAAYKKYKDKNFKVLSVSLDEQKEAWIKAIKEDKLPWTQISDLKGADSEVAKMYNIISIPANVLIDPNGKIVGKNLKGKALHDRLAELIK